MEIRVNDKTVIELPDDQEAQKRIARILYGALFEWKMRELEREEVAASCLTSGSVFK